MSAPYTDAREMEIYRLMMSGLSRNEAEQIAEQNFCNELARDAGKNWTNENHKWEYIGEE